MPIPTEQNSLAQETTVIFLLSSFQYIFLGIAYNTATHFRAPAYLNCMPSPFAGRKLTCALLGPFMASTGFLCLFTTYLTLAPHDGIAWLLDIAPLEPEFRLVLLVIALSRYSPLLFATLIRSFLLACSYRSCSRSW